MPILPIEVDINPGGFCVQVEAQIHTEYPVVPISTPTGTKEARKSNSDSRFDKIKSRLQSLCSRMSALEQKTCRQDDSPPPSPGEEVVEDKTDIQLIHNRARYVQEDPKQENLKCILMQKTHRLTWTRLL